MTCTGAPPAAAKQRGRPAFEVADVFRAHGEAFRNSHALSGDQLKVMRAIEACRTETLGGHLDVCPRCTFERPSYNSCRNRHCPKCQSLVQARWIEQRIERILATHYFHVVFTLPAELRSLVRVNRVLLFDLLFSCASRTLLQLGDDPKRLGGRLGITAVLHTWTRELTFHPHLHCIVTGGGLAPDGDHWRASTRQFLFPVKVMGALFRGKFIDGLRRLRTDEKLKYEHGARELASQREFSKLIAKLYDKDWVVYAKKPFAGPEHVFRYLGRYTHRVGISNQRIQAFDKAGVRFATKNGKAKTLEPSAFIQRFLDHVLPTGFTKIRHFGLHASGNVKSKLARAQKILTCATSQPPNPVEPPPEPREPPSWQERLRALTGDDITRCPACVQPLRRLPLCRNPTRRDSS